jgi:glycosyltransferase involved in cell wall biosynthesis
MGLISRVKNILFSYKKQCQINHITGDVHYIALLLHKKKTVLTIHDLEILKRTKGLTHFIIWLFWFYMPAKRVQLITVISEETKRDLLNFVKINPSKIIVIPNCVSANFKPNAPVENPIFTILHIGTKQNKNMERLINAISGINCKLNIVGKLNQVQLDLLLKYNIDYSNKYNLSESELINEYRKCDMLAFVSTSEGFGLPILEAQAVGRPVLTSNISSMPGVAGNAALLVDPYNIEEIRSGILKIMRDDDLRKKLASKGFDNIKKYSAESVAMEYANLYNKIAAQRKQ